MVLTLQKYNRPHKILISTIIAEAAAKAMRILWEVNDPNEIESCNNLEIVDNVVLIFAAKTESPVNKEANRRNPKSPKKLV